jgi:serine/threonine-protein kinase RsbT
MAQIEVPVQIKIVDDSYTVVAAQYGRRLAQQLNFSHIEQTALCTAILEITRNAAKYAGGGIITLDAIYENERAGILVTTKDTGPGINDIELALQDGYSTGKGLGRGLPGAKRLMDTFEICSQIGLGTVVTMTKWKK